MTSLDKLTKADLIAKVEWYQGLYKDAQKDLDEAHETVGAMQEDVTCALLTVRLLMTSPSREVLLHCANQVCHFLNPYSKVTGQFQFEEKK